MAEFTSNRVGRGDRPPAGENGKRRLLYVEPETRFARLERQRIAYSVLGDGPLDLVGSMGSFFSMDATWALPEAALPFEELSSSCRLILFDRLGTGSSDPVPIDALPPLESRWAEIEAVMKSAESERAVVLGVQDGGPPAMYGAATSPENVAGLITLHSPAKFVRDEDYSIGMDPDDFTDWESMLDNWDTDTMIKISFPSRSDERFLAWGRRYMRALAGPGAMWAYTSEMISTDIRSLLPLIAVPTTVLHRRDYQWSTAELDRYVADNIAGARYVEIPGGDASLYFSHTSAMVDAIVGFLREIDPGTGQPVSSSRVMSTVRRGYEAGGWWLVAGGM